MSKLEIRPAAPEDMDRVREVFRDYADWLNVDYCLKDFEAELAGLPGAFAPPRGGLWLAWAADDLAGCVGLRPLEAEGSGDGCEMRRLWVRAAYRGQGLGRALAQAALAGARTAGYREMSLETLGHMEAARSLYASLGFRPEVRNYEGLDDDLRFMVCDLKQESAASA